MNKPLILIFFAFICFIFSILAFFEKGPLLNNAFLFAPKKEKEKMDKSPHYRQSGICFMLMGIYFLIEYANIVYKLAVLKYISWVVLASLLIYAVWSAVKIGKMQRKD